MAHVLASELRKAVVQSAIEGKLTNRLLTDSLIYDNITKIEKEIEILKKQKKWKNIKIIKNEKLPFVIPEEWAWVKLGDIMRIESGDGLISNKMTGSGYPVYGGNGINGYHDAYNISESHIVIGRVGAKCGCVHVTEEYAWVTDNAFIVTYPKKSINKGYLVLCLKAFNLGTRSNSTAQPVVSGQNLYPINLPLPPIEEQARIVARVDELMAKIDEYEKLENELVELKKNFPGDMKAAVLQAAMQGKLTEQLISDSEVYRELLSTKNYPKIEELYDLPENWINAHLEDLTNSIATKQYQILEKDVCKEGKYPVISQSKEYSIGFTNNEERVFNPSSKIVLFGDHTTIVKTIDYPFVVGADGVKLFECTNFILPEYLYYVLTFNSSLISEVGGYSRHYKYLKNKSIPLPPIEEQKRIVEKLDKILPLCEELEKEVV